MFRDGALRVKDAANFVLPSYLRSRDAQRVNAILSLYDRALDNPVLGQLAFDLKAAADRLDLLRQEVDNVSNVDRLRLPTLPTVYSSRQLAEHYKDDPELRGAARALLSADDAMTAAWREALTVLASEERREAIKKSDTSIPKNTYDDATDDASDALWAVAEIAAGLTTPEGIRKFLLDGKAPERLRQGRLGRIGGDIRELLGGNEIDPPTFKPIQGFLTRVLLGQRLSTDPCRDPASCAQPAQFRARGIELARELLAAEAYMVSIDGPRRIVRTPAPFTRAEVQAINDRLQDVRGHTCSVPDLACDTEHGRREGELRTAIMRAVSSSIQSDQTDRRADLTYLNENLSQHALTGLGAGRQEKGIEELIGDYLALFDQDKRARRPRGDEGKQQRLLTLGLVHFAEKVLVIANNDVLLRDQTHGNDENVKKYVQVLQAVGNSILTQVDELRHRDDYLRRDRLAAKGEELGLRNAEALSARAALPDVLKEIGEQADVPGLPELQAAVKAAGNDVKAVRDAIRSAAGAQQAAGADAKRKGDQSGVALDVLAETWVTEIVTALPTEARPAPTMKTFVDRLKAELEERKTPKTGAQYSTTIAVVDATVPTPDATTPKKPVPALSDLIALLQKAKAGAEAGGAAKKAEADRLGATVDVLTNEPWVIKQVSDWPTTVAVTPTTATLITRLKAEMDKRMTAANRQRYTDAAAAINAAMPTPDASTERRPGSAFVDLQAAVASAKRTAEGTAEKATETAKLYTGWRERLDLQLAGAWPKLEIPDHSRAGGSRRDVADIMLATLRYEHVNVVARVGDESVVAQKLRSAYELMAAYKSAMVYIRPSAAYLRNSYPASTLQRNPTFGVWRNMLTDQALRQIPFYENTMSTEVGVAIDKQFWQNVNQVRLAGAGNTNYAIAKDDVGNWYLKTYSTEVDDIINSARNLAMFSAGASLGATIAPTPAPGGTGPAQTGAATTTQRAPTTTAARGALKNQLDRFSAKYQKEAVASRQSLRRQAQGLVAAVRTAVTAHVTEKDDLKRIEDEVIVKAENELKPGATGTPTLYPDMVPLVKDPTDAETQEETNKTAVVLDREILNGLRVIKKFGDSIQAAIGKVIKKPGDTDGGKLSDATIKDARDGVAEAIKAVLSSILAGRRTSIDQYETAVIFTGQTSGLSLGQ